MLPTFCLRRIFADEKAWLLSETSLSKAKSLVHIELKKIVKRILTIESNALLQKNFCFKHFFLHI